MTSAGLLLMNEASRSHRSGMVVVVSGPVVEKTAVMRMGFG